MDSKVISSAYSENELLEVHTVLRNKLSTQIKNAQKNGATLKFKTANIALWYNPTPTGAIILEIEIKDKKETLLQKDWAFESLKEMVSSLEEIASDAVRELQED